MPSAWDSWITTMRTNPNITLNTLVDHFFEQASWKSSGSTSGGSGALTGERTMRASGAPSPRDSRSRSSTSSRSNTSDSNRNSQNSNSTRRPPKIDIVCNNCFRPGHDFQHCWNKGGGAEGQGPRGRRGSGNGRRGQREQAHAASSTEDSSSSPPADASTPPTDLAWLAAPQGSAMAVISDIAAPAAAVAHSSQRTTLNSRLRLHFSSSS